MTLYNCHKNKLVLCMDLLLLLLFVFRFLVLFTLKFMILTKVLTKKNNANIKWPLILRTTSQYQNRIESDSSDTCKFLRTQNLSYLNCSMCICYHFSHKQTGQLCVSVNVHLQFLVYSSNFFQCYLNLSCWFF